MITRIFRSEREAGLTQALRDTGGFTLAGQAFPATHPPSDSQIKEQLQRASLATATNLNQMDLYYLDSLLVSTGMNLNDDFFERMETWSARFTPEDKPLNMAHDRDDILGHMTGCWPVDASKENRLALDLDADEVPDRFHLVNSAVLYRRCKSEERQARTDAIISEIPSGKWKVSMEAFFTDFDYILVPKGQANAELNWTQARIVERNEQTSFLTKYLRAYEGQGVYSTYRVGRVLRNITFGGVALCEQPANPESVIFTTASLALPGNAPNFSRLDEALGYQLLETQSEKAGGGNPTQERNMNEVEALQKQITDLTAKLTKSESALAEIQTKNHEAKATELASQLKVAEENLKKAQAELAAAQTTNKDLVEKLAAAKVDTDKAVADAQKAQAELDAIQTQRRADARLATVKKVFPFGGTEAEAETQAKAMADSLMVLSDEAFEKYIASAKAVKLGETNVSNLPSPMGGHPPVVRKLSVTAAGLLEDAKPNTEPSLSAASASDSDDLAGVAEDVLSYVRKNKTKGKAKSRRPVAETIEE